MEPVWSKVSSKYKLLSIIGFGTFGQVVEAQNKSTNEIVAIKLISNIFRNELYLKKVISEVQTLRQLTQISGNIFTTKLLDVIMSGGDTEDADSYLFIVMECVEYDLKKVLESN